MAYGDFEDLPRRIASDELLRDNVLSNAKIRNRMNIKDVLF